MTDYYSILGISPTASQDEIKKAYRKLANQHHPDKGGDQAKFKDISVAYDTLSDSNKRAEYDMQRQGGGNREFRFNTSNAGFQDMSDLFSAHFGGPFGHNSPFGDIFGRPHRKNRDLNIQCKISLLDSYTGKELEANFKLPSGKNQTVAITVPAGINHGETIRYTGLGDDSIPNIPRGHLNVTIIVMPDDNFSRVNDDLYTTVNVNPIEAMIGCKKKVQLITGQELEIEIRGGVSPGREYASAGQGFTNPHNGRKGRFVTVINISSPHITDPALIKKLSDLNDEISKQ